MNGFAHHHNTGGGGQTDLTGLYGIFTIWAEENADTNNGAFEWSYGNGNETPSGMGVIFPMPCELFALGLATEGTSTNEVEARKNANSTGKSVTVTNAKNDITVFSDDVVAYDVNDIFGVRTITGSTASNGGLVCAWFRYRLDLFTSSP